MPRPRKNDPGAMILPLVEQFALRLGATLERFIAARVAKETRSSAARGRGGRRRRRRAKVLCYVPGCKNVAAPRFGMFCAAEHKGLPKAEKEKYRARHARAAEKGEKNGS